MLSFNISVVLTNLVYAPNSNNKTPTPVKPFTIPIHFILDKVVKGINRLFNA